MGWRVMVTVSAAIPGVSILKNLSVATVGLSNVSSEWP